MPTHRSPLRAAGDSSSDPQVLTNSARVLVPLRGLAPLLASGEGLSVSHQNWNPGPGAGQPRPSGSTSPSNATVQRPSTEGRQPVAQPNREEALTRFEARMPRGALHHPGRDRPAPVPVPGRSAGVAPCSPPVAHALFPPASVSSLGARRHHQYPDRRVLPEFGRPGRWLGRLNRLLCSGLAKDLGDRLPGDIQPGEYRLLALQLLGNFVICCRSSSTNEPITAPKVVATP